LKKIKTGNRKMGSSRVSEIEKKKIELENELTRIQEGIDKSIDGVKEEVVENLDPKTIIRKYPLHVLGASVLVGFLIGKPKSSGSSSDSLIASELKKALAKKGLSMLSDLIEGKMNSREK
tara:strand:- start:31482 stop:31841 length:360 start_codon:yes stop_codon:yes gene_type:complete